jgi:hydroxylamine reductase (hybrid-cluster protein)
MEENIVSFRKSVRIIFELIKKGNKNICNRYETQRLGDSDNRCCFCANGVLFDLYYNRYNRIDVEKDKKGVHGIYWR